MRRIPTLDWTCARCGRTETLELVKVTGEGHGTRSADEVPHAQPTLDFTCSRCGTTETYALVKAGAAPTRRSTPAEAV